MDEDVLLEEQRLINDLSRMVQKLSEAARRGGQSEQWWQAQRLAIEALRQRTQELRDRHLGRATP